MIIRRSSSSGSSKCGSWCRTAFSACFVCLVALTTYSRSMLLLKIYSFLQPSWSAFEQFGWKIRFMRDYMHNDEFKDVNPNTYGMVESIVCSKAKAFAGTYFSTFTGYIHRLRGYHGLGETTYYHHKNFLFNLQMKKSVGHGWSREFRAGWTDDGGGLI